MEFDSGHRYSQSATLNFPQHYYFNERNIPLAVSNGTRPDPRGYPVGGPVGGPRLRGGMGREDNTSVESGQARRRIAVACARCRKRKIRCSGDPGNGTGCSNCKQAGVDANLCQFHRVGSDNVTRVLEQQEYQRLHLANNLTGIANPHAMMPVYTTSGGPLYSRAMPNQYPSLDTKAVYQPGWTIPYSEETSPVETYNLDQPAAYLPNQNAMAAANVYGGSYRWSQTSGKHLQGGANPFLDQDGMPVYGTHGLPYMQTNLRAATASEALSPLNMTSLQLTLPERPHPRPVPASDPTVPQRQLPIPQPSPAQTSRNVVDQLQDQRLRSAQAMGTSSLSTGGVFPKPALPFNSDSDVQVPAAVETSTSDLAAQVTASASLPSTTESTMGYLAVTTSVSDDTTTSSAAAQPQLNFTTSTLLGAMPAPAIQTTYSNFRNYNLPTSSSTETLSTLARQNSQTSLYSFSTDATSKRHSSGDASNDSALVSGHRYTPLNQTQSQSKPQPNLEGLRRDPFDTRSVSIHCSSMSNINRSF